MRIVWLLITTVAGRQVSRLGEMSDCQAEAARWLRDASCQQVTPSQRVQISIENSRCEFRSAGLQTPAECLETLAEPELVGCTE